MRSLSWGYINVQFHYITNSVVTSELLTEDSYCVGRIDVDNSTVEAFNDGADVSAAYCTQKVLARFDTKAKLILINLETSQSATENLCHTTKVREALIVYTTLMHCYRAIPKSAV